MVLEPIDPIFLPSAEVDQAALEAAEELGPLDMLHCPAAGDPDLEPKGKPLAGRFLRSEIDDERRHFIGRLVAARERA